MAVIRSVPTGRLVMEELVALPPLSRLVLNGPLAEENTTWPVALPAVTPFVCTLAVKVTLPPNGEALADEVSARPRTWARIILSMVRVSVRPGPPHCQESSWKANCQVAPTGLADVRLPKFTLKVCQVLATVNCSFVDAFITGPEPPK